MVFALGQTRDLQLAALQDSSACDRDVLKAGRALGHCCLSSIEARYETTSEIRHRGERVRLATLVDDNKRGSLLDPEAVGFEVPAGVRSASSRLICGRSRAL